MTNHFWLHFPVCVGRGLANGSFKTDQLAGAVDLIGRGDHAEGETHDGAHLDGQAVVSKAEHLAVTVELVLHAGLHVGIHEVEHVETVVSCEIRQYGVGHLAEGIAGLQRLCLNGCGCTKEENQNLFHCFIVLRVASS